MEAVEALLDASLKKPTNGAEKSASEDVVMRTPDRESRTSSTRRSRRERSRSRDRDGDRERRRDRSRSRDRRERGIGIGIGIGRGEIGVGKGGRDMRIRQRRIDEDETLDPLPVVVAPPLLLSAPVRLLLHVPNALLHPN
ncbi:hypothetical protein BT69DRAFT_81678 [Atractiella rhizophila]|nr:hypothetical protein BT69DRAFT_81678 [Atractiella rhizophila]